MSALATYKNKDIETLLAPLTPDEAKLLERKPPHMLVYDKKSGSDKKVELTPAGLMEEARILRNAGNYDGSLFQDSLAESLVEPDDFEKLGKIKYQMAETLQRRAADDSLGESREARFSYLDQADEYLKESSDLLAIAANQKAKHLHEHADDDSLGEPVAARLAQLDKADEALVQSDELYETSRIISDYERNNTRRTRRFLLGAKAVMSAAKSTIKSTLNRHS